MLNLLGTCKQTIGQVFSLMDPMEVDPMEVDEAAPALFAQCRFALVCGNDFSEDAAHKVCEYSMNASWFLTWFRLQQH